MFDCVCQIFFFEFSCLMGSCNLSRSNLIFFLYSLERALFFFFFYCSHFFLVFKCSIQEVESPSVQAHGNEVYDDQSDHVEEHHLVLY